MFCYFDVLAEKMAVLSAPSSKIFVCFFLSFLVLLRVYIRSVVLLLIHVFLLVVLFFVLLSGGGRVGIVVMRGSLSIFALSSQFFVGSRASDKGFFVPTLGSAVVTCQPFREG